MDGTVVDGFVVDGAVVDGFVADGAVVDGFVVVISSPGLKSLLFNTTTRLYVFMSPFCALTLIFRLLTPSEIATLPVLPLTEAREFTAAAFTVIFFMLPSSIR